MFRVIDQFNLKEKRVFIRVDYNVPLSKGQITDDTRIRESLPTIEYAIQHGARIVLGSHRGRPKGIPNEKDSLFPVAEYLSKILKKDIIFTESAAGDGIKKLTHDLRPGEIILLENLRFHPEEEANDPKFSQQLASLADIYIDDAFGVIHRAHASIVGMVSYFSSRGIGFLVQKEIKFLSSLLHSPQKPFVVILGGVKVSDKIGIIENLMNHANTFIIGGAMAYTFLKAKGLKVGRSFVEEAKVHQAERLLNRAEVKGVNIYLPVDSILAEKIEEGVPTRIVKNSEDWGDWMGLDIGPESIRIFSEQIKKAKTIFWNGPMGAFEIPAFQKGTFELARAIAESEACSVVGGGDSVAAIRQSGVADKINHLSTGGGASLEFLEGKVLPGLKAVEAIGETADYSPKLF